MAAVCTPGLLAQIGGGIGMGMRPADASTSPVNVTGVVINAVTGMPVPRALVQLGNRAMLTDHEGKFEFDQFAESRGMMRVTKPGYYSSREAMGNEFDMLTGSELSQPQTLRLYPEALLTGTVTAPDGSPLEHVLVAAMLKVDDEVSRRWAQMGVSDTNVRGEFRLTVPAGEYKLRILSAGQRSLSPDFVMPLVFPGSSSSEISDSIKVRDGQEQHFDLHPKVGRAYTVWVSSQTSGHGFAMFQVRMADGTVFQPGAQQGVGGLYRIQLPNGSYTLTATENSPDGQEIAETDVTVAGHDVSGVVLRFQPVPAVPIEISTDSDMSDKGDPASPAVNPYSLGLSLQRVTPEIDWGAGSVYPVQQKDGTLAFRLQPGTYRLKSRSNGGQWFVESATYGDRDLLRQDMVIAPGAGGLPIRISASNQTGTLSGSVSIHGAPMHGMVYLIPTTPGAVPVFITQSNLITGAYSAKLPPGNYRAVAFEKRHSFDPDDPNALAPYASHERTITIAAGDKAMLDLDAVSESEMKP